MSFFISLFEMSLNRGGSWIMLQKHHALQRALHLSYKVLYNTLLTSCLTFVKDAPIEGFIALYRYRALHLLCPKRVLHHTVLISCLTFVMDFTYRVVYHTVLITCLTCVTYLLYQRLIPEIFFLSYQRQPNIINVGF